MGVLFTRLLYCFVIMLGSCTFGCVLVYPSPALPKMSEEFGWKQDDGRFTLFNAISSAAAIFGPYLCGFLLKHLGRRPVVGIFGFMGSISWMMLYFLKKTFFWYGIMVRAFLGIVIGGLSSVCPMYIVELSPPDYTGFFGSFNQLGICVGIFTMYLSGNFLTWQNLALYGMSIDILLFILIWFIPESPVIKNSKDPMVTESIFQKKYLSRMIMSILMFLFQQFCGTNAILTNMATLLDEAHLDLPPNIQSAIAGASKVIAVFCGAFLIQKFGRKVIFVTSHTGCAISLLIYALSEKITFPSSIALILIFCLFLFFSIGAGPIPWFIISEVFEPAVRPMASSIITSSNWIFTFLVIEIYPYLKKAITFFGCMLLFSCIAGIAAVFGFLFVQKDYQSGSNAKLLESNYNNFD
ncbi:major facilitator superfamily transporter [Tritrichomonas foetus]|uniref:Major facilitator superfamily transporter n=1 Tax=Tritrichomonas foetus TaxID=1144522 RepID=A0A1J4KJ97_9EUKA|nr:major facilitator superfamily transporter [Tritrichomonas foetus]|eukprot:OHT11425.1 major facilitator superfamily transporter [Tritrichomonas foetus]